MARPLVDTSAAMARRRALGDALRDSGLRLAGEGDARWEEEGVYVAKRRTPWHDGDPSLVISETFVAVRGGGRLGPQCFNATQSALEFAGLHGAEEKGMIKVGDLVHVRMIEPARLATGTVRFMGTPQEAGVFPSSVGRNGADAAAVPGGTAFDGKALWVGVELRQPWGTHDGRVAKQRYFTAAPNHGVFAPPRLVLKAGEGKAAAGAAAVYDGFPSSLYKLRGARTAGVVAHAPVKHCEVTAAGASYSVHRYAIAFQPDAGGSAALSANQKTLMAVIKRDVTFVHPKLLPEYLRWWHMNEDPKIKLADQLAVLMCERRAEQGDGDTQNDDALLAELEREQAGVTEAVPAAPIPAVPQPNVTDLSHKLDAQARILAQMLAEPPSTPPAVAHSPQRGRSRSPPPCQSSHQSKGRARPAHHDPSA